MDRFEKPCNCGRLESALDRKRVKRCNCFCSHCCNDCIPSGSQWEVRFENQRDRDACKLLFGNHTLQQGRFRFLTNKRFMLSRPSISCLGSTHTTLRVFRMPLANVNPTMFGESRAVSKRLTTTKIRPWRGNPAPLLGNYQCYCL